MSELSRGYFSYCLLIKKTKPLPTPSKSADVYDGRRLRFVDLAALASSQHVIARNEVIYASMDRLWKLDFIP